MKRNLLIVFSFLVLLSELHAQSAKYWIMFKDKDVAAYNYEKYLSETCLANRRKFNIPLFQYSDIPVNTAYVQSVQMLGPVVVGRSRWFNAISAYMTQEQVQRVAALSYVAAIESIDHRLVVTSTEINTNPEYVHTAMKQMGIMSFKEEGLDGTGVVIGVIDAGFYDAQNDEFLLHLFEESKILCQRDFIDPARKDIIEQQATDSDYHGRMVLDMIAGYNAERRLQYGMATNSQFVLARTENGATESRREEDNWIMAMEWMDSLGVRLISTSLGYAINMDDPADNYSQSEMDGKTARITKAAQMAFDDKGIFLVVSAGNEGDNEKWRIIGAPADSRGALSVGATNQENLLKINYSSIGPEALPYLKPNVSCFSPNGTSFSCPAVTGFVACLMQRDPDKSNKDLKAIVERSGHLYPYGNNYIGYGVPQAPAALLLLSDSTWVNEDVVSRTVVGKKYQLKLTDKKFTADVELYHKKDTSRVISQQLVHLSKGKLTVVRPAGAVRTTLSIGTDFVGEIMWEDKK